MQSGNAKKKVSCLFKIGEFSKLVRVSARMLRHYEKCGLLCPAQIDRFTGYRMYSAAQIPLVSRIVTLRDMGFLLEEIEELLPYCENAQVMQKALAEKSREIQGTIALEQRKLEKIVALTKIMKRERMDMVYEVELKELKAQKVLSLRETIVAYDREGELWEKLGMYIAKNHIACDAGGYSIYHDEDYKDSDVDVEVAIPVPALNESRDGFVYRELPAIPLAATIRFTGPYEGYTAAMEKLAAWTEKQGYAFDGLIRGLAVASPMSVNSPADFVTELQVPVKKVS